MIKQEDAVTEIPIEMIEEILVRLPVVDLLRFRCVSKKWRNLIDSPNFVKFHMNLPNKPQSVLVIDHEQRISYFDLDSGSNASSPANLKKLGKPCYEVFSHKARVLGQINGLVCSFCDRDPGVIIWNPWTMKHIQVPPPEEQGVGFWTWGFGYDRDSDDYNVIILAETGSAATDRTLVMIYSLRYGSWRSLDDCPYNYSRSDCWPDVVFSDGAFYWKVKSPSDPRFFLICALHLGKLEYNLVPTPNLDSSTYVLERLRVLGGCLSAICRRPFRPEIDLWVMKESWTRLMHYDDDYRSIIPLSCIQNGNELLFVTGDMVMSYEFKTGSFKRVLRLSSRFSKSVVCNPSFVCPSN